MGTSTVSFEERKKTSSVKNTTKLIITLFAMFLYSSTFSRLFLDEYSPQLRKETRQTTEVSTARVK
jgi:hypothetical protein